MSDVDHDHQRNWRWLGAAIVLPLILATVVRCLLLLGSAHNPDKPSVDQIRVALSSLPNPGDAATDDHGFSLTPLVRDPRAQIILGYGADKQPGRAGLDDNFDRKLDNDLELGAIGSDDVCLAPWQSDYATTRQLPGTRVIGIGEYVKATEPPDDTDVPTRWLLSGYDWTWLVIR